MTRSTPRRLAAPVLLVTATALVLAGVGLTRERRAAAEAEAAWDVALAEVDAIEARIDARSDARPVLWGEATDGAAWPHYLEALALVEGIDGDAVVRARQGGDPGALRARAALVAAHRDALTALGRGAHARRLGRPVDWSRGFDEPATKLLQARHLTQLAAMQARLLLDAGEHEQAVAVLLDGLQLAGDLSHGPMLIEEMIGIALLNSDFLVETVESRLLVALRVPARERLTQGLATLEARLGWCPESLESELVLFVRSLERALAGDPPADAEFLLPDSGAVDRSACLGFAADHVASMQRAIAALETACAGTPADLAAALDRIEELAVENSLSARILPSFRSAVRSRLYSVGRFRLLSYAVSGETAALDPWLAASLRDETTDGTRTLSADEPLFGGLSIEVASH